MKETFEVIAGAEGAGRASATIASQNRQNHPEWSGPCAVSRAQQIERQRDAGVSSNRNCGDPLLSQTLTGRSVGVVGMIVYGRFDATRSIASRVITLWAIIVGLAVLSGCSSTPATKHSISDDSAAIPDRPEELQFPPLNYEPPKPEDYRVALKNGSVAYVLEDHELPLVNISVLVRTGDYVEPDGKEGVASLTGYLLSRGGTKSWTAEELEERLAYLAANLGSGIGDTQGSIELNLLSKDLDEGLGILREVLAEPRFQEDKIALRKQQMLQAMKQRNDESAAIEGRERSILAFGEKFYVNNFTTSNSVESVTREDLRAFHQKWFYPSNFVVAVNGDFDREAMVEKLERLFANWPHSGEQPPPVPTNTEFASAGIYVVNKDVNQGRVSIQLPGIMRDNPDYFPVMLMNDILGGGGFTSRIMNRVRSDEGLAYSAGSSFRGGVYYPLTFVAAFQSKSRTVPYATSIVLDEISQIGDGLVSQQELETAREGLIDRFPRTFATKEQVVSTFASDEFTGRFQSDPDYWKKFRDNVRSVTREDIQRVAQKYLHRDRAVILVVGQEDEILLGHPNHPVQLKDLSSGPYVKVPLRDPLTMKPLSESGNSKN